MNRAGPLGMIFLVALLLCGCVTNYVTVHGVAKSELRVTVITDDPYRGAAFLEILDERGFDNEENRLGSNPAPEFSIRYGAAPTAYIEELALAVKQTHGVDPQRLCRLGPHDLDVIISLPVGPGDVPARSEFEVTIFADDEERGDLLLAALLALGYTSEDNEVLDEPNEDYNIKYGAAPEEYITEISDCIEAECGVRPDDLRVFDYDDYDIFVNLPSGSGSPSERTNFEITVFCDNELVGAEVLESLAELGYTNGDNEVLGGPNEDYNIKYGALPEELLEEIVELLEERFDVEFEQLEIFDPDDGDVFINIPHR